MNFWGQAKRGKNCLSKIKTSKKLNQTKSTLRKHMEPQIILKSTMMLGMNYIES